MKVSQYHHVSQCLIFTFSFISATFWYIIVYDYHVLHTVTSYISLTLFNKNINYAQVAGFRWARNKRTSSVMLGSFSRRHGLVPCAYVCKCFLCWLAAAYLIFQGPVLEYWCLCVSPCLNSRCVWEWMYSGCLYLLICGFIPHAISCTVHEREYVFVSACTFHCFCL